MKLYLGLVKAVVADYGHPAVTELFWHLVCCNLRIVECLSVAHIDQGLLAEGTGDVVRFEKLNQTLLVHAVTTRIDHGDKDGVLHVGHTDRAISLQLLRPTLVIVQKVEPHAAVAHFAVERFVATAHSANSAFITVEDTLFLSIVVVERANGAIIFSEVLLAIGAGF